MIKKPETFIFFGPSGSGKGTQANLLKEYLEKHDSERKTLYVETGQRFRDFVAHNTSHTRDLTKDVMDSGGLMPEFMPIWVWAQFLVDNFSGEEHLILDGLSRRAHEAPVLDGAMKFYKRDKPFVVEIKVSREWALERLMGRGRSDDDPIKITTRLDWYWEQVLPAVEFFRTSPDYYFLEINGEQPIENVHGDLVKAVEKFL